MVFNIGKADDHPIVQALLADHKCINCPKPGAIMMVDTSDRISDEQYKAFTAELRELNAWIMANPTIRGDGVEPLSDTKAPEQFIGRRT